MTTQYLDRPDGRIAYDDSGGDGPLVVAAPGMGDVRAVYRFTVPQLAAAGYRVVTMDVRGHGESSTGWPDYSVPALAADILALVAHLDAGPARILAESGTAGAAVWAAAEQPDRVAALVLFGPFGVRTVPAAWWRRLLQAVAIPLVSRSAGLWTRYYRGLYPTAPPVDLPAYLTALRANLAEPGRLAALRGMLAAGVTAEARLPEVSAPALVVMGTEDPDFPDPAAEASWVAQRLDGRALMVDGAGHYPMTEMPEVVGPELLAFLEPTRVA